MIIFFLAFHAPFPASVGSGISASGTYGPKDMQINKYSGR